MPLSFVMGTVGRCQTPEHDPEINSSSVIYSDFIWGNYKENVLDKIVVLYIKSILEAPYNDHLMP